MNILRDDISSDGAGGQIKSGATAVNDEPIPCSCAPRMQRGNKGEHGDRFASVAEYNVTFAMHHLGDPIDIMPSDRLLILARGNQPDKLFRIVDLKDSSGVVYEAVCERENNE